MVYALFSEPRSYTPIPLDTRTTGDRLCPLMRIEDRDLPSSILDPRSSILKEVFMARRNFSAGSTKFLSFILTIALGVPALSFGTRSETSDQATVWTPELSMKVKAVGGVQVSPDGKRVLYTVNEPVMVSEKSEYLTQIWMASADGGDAYQMTFGEKPSTNPDWSPDGRWIAFTSSRSGKNNLYLMRSTGGEAEMITDVKSGVGRFALGRRERQDEPPLRNIHSKRRCERLRGQTRTAPVDERRFHGRLGAWRRRRVRLVAGRQINRLHAHKNAEGR